MERHENTETESNVRYDPSDASYSVFECPECDNVVLALGQDDPPLSYHSTCHRVSTPRQASTLGKRSNLIGS